MAEAVIVGKKRSSKRGPHKLKTAGKRKAKIAAYYAGKYFQHKVRRILDTQGKPAAQSWADKHSCLSILQAILAKREKQ